MTASAAAPPRRLDVLGANAAPAPATRLVEGWLARSAPHLPFRRANCVLPAEDAGADPERTAVALAALEAWYREREHHRLLVQVPGYGTGPALDAQLEQAGFGAEAPVDVLTGATAEVAAAGERSGDRFRVSLEEAVASGRARRLPRVVITFDDPRDRAFVPEEGRRRELEGRLPELDRPWWTRDARYRAMFAAIPSSVLAGVVLVDGEPVAVGYGVAERGWVGVFGMATAAAWRRRGLGGLLVGALAVEGRRRGAEHLYLQVEAGNAAAQALYGSLGLHRSHGYRYRVRDLG